MAKLQLTQAGILSIICFSAVLMGMKGPHNGDTCAHRNAIVQFDTRLGSFDIQLFGEQAPITVCNFLKYVESGRFDGGEIFRTVRPDNQNDKPVPISVVQVNIRAGSGKAFPPIPIERTSITGIRHLDGTVSMARAAADSATSSFFVSVGAQPELDYGGRRSPDGQGFAAFGRLVCGMRVVRLIWQQPASGEQLTPPITIDRALLVEKKLCTQEVTESTSSECC